MIRVTHYQRRPNMADFSIERIFAVVREAMPGDILCRAAVSRVRSRGVIRRFYNALEAALRQGDVNHITGDVHYLALFLRKRRTILTIHDCGTLDRLAGWKRWLYGWLWFRLPIARSAVVTAISAATRDDLLRRFDVPSGKVRVIHDCIPPEFEPWPKTFDAAKPRILQVGTRANKNLQRVVQALKGIPCHLDIVGTLSDEQRQSLAVNSIEYSNESRLSDEDLLAKYRKCDMLVFVSTKEGFGMPIVEAQAVGRPVVTSNIPPMPETGGDGACYVDPTDVASIRQGILRVIQDGALRAELARNGMENAKRFRPEVIAAMYAELYREVALSWSAARGDGN